MMTAYDELKAWLPKEQRTWLITGVAGFIGSNLLEALLLLDQRVVGLDNFSTGSQANLDDVEKLVSSEQWSNFNFYEGDIRKLNDCMNACEKVDFVLHQAALGSVPRSIENPINTNETNINGFLNMLISAKEMKVKSFIYAASSSTYGDHPGLPKIEDQIGMPLSPYAVTKYVNELYSGVFAKCYGFKSVGLRYFNVFGKRQDPKGAYAAVIPAWISSLLEGKSIFINGDGETTRDFCHVDNVIQANIRAAIADKEALDNVYNIAVGESISLNGLYEQMRIILELNGINASETPIYRDFRAGDVRHSLASIDKARKYLGYEPEKKISDSLVEVMGWYILQNKRKFD